MAFLEPMVHEVQAPPGGLFHPKLWFLRFTGEDEPDAYRLVVLSRNLTDDHAWDVSLTLDASRGTRPSASNRPLSALIRSLPERTRQPVPTDRRARIAQLAEDARYLEWELPDGATDIGFHVFGLTGERAIPDLTGHRHLVVSPFLNDDGLVVLTTGSKNVTVVSRPLALDQLHPDTIATLTKTYVVSTVAGLDDGDTNADDIPAPLLSDLHAKLVVVERGQQAHLFVGLANATDAALRRNVEILVELTGGRKKLGIGTMLDPDSPFLGMLEAYRPPGGAGPDPDAEASGASRTRRRRWSPERRETCVRAVYTGAGTPPGQPEADGSDSCSRCVARARVAPVLLNRNLPLHGLLPLVAVRQPPLAADPGLGSHCPNPTSSPATRPEATQLIPVRQTTYLGENPGSATSRRSGHQPTPLMASL